MNPTLQEIYMRWFYYYFWGFYHNEDPNTCINCGMPAYRRWDNRYNGARGFCTTCDANWPED